MSGTHNPVLEEYRKTLTLLHRLLKQKRIEKADPKQLRVVLEEIDEVSRTIAHLEKGDLRWKWESESSSPPL